MIVSVFGLGYVGCVSAACFAKEGFSVVGVDVTQTKVELINQGKATIVEQGIAELVEAMVGVGRLRATRSVAEAVGASDISLVCVGTPSRPNGSLDLSYLERVALEIGDALRSDSRPHTVVVRSTALPGTAHQLVAPALERASGRKLGENLFVASNPEFLREGTSVKDFYDPPFTLIGADDAETGNRIAGLYHGIDAPVHITDVRVAEMVKYACNSFHGLKVGFANEIGKVCKALGVDSHEVMRVFVEDRKLNVSPAYLKPGFAFGGSCLPKDLRAVTYRAREMDVPTPILTAALESNRLHIEHAYRMVMSTGKRKIGLLGIAFKAGTDDLRESPMVTLIEMLIGKGCALAIYDREVTRANLIGANREYIEREIPHIWSLVTDNLDDLLAESETIVIGNPSGEFRTIQGRLRPDQVVVDLVRAFRGDEMPPGGYHGICW